MNQIVQNGSYHLKNFADLNGSDWLRLTSSWERPQATTSEAALNRFLCDVVWITF
jgi:hypothetical protein